MTTQEINIAVKTVNNDLYNLTVEGSTSVADLKSRIQDITTIDVNRQRLIYKGRVLVDNTVVQDYNIEDGHTVHMVARPANFQELQQSAGMGQPSTSAAAAPTSAPGITAAPQTRILTSTGATLAIGPADESNTMEHIRQNLLTLHTLLSTVSPAELASPQGTANASDNEQMRTVPSVADHPANRRSTTAQAETEQPAGASHRQFYVGQWVDVKDTVNQWLEATIMNINEAERQMFVHYNGWPDRWDEWISFDSPRVSPFRSRTVHSTLTPYLSPTPNVSLARAPVTGANDLRTLLPEIARMFRVLQPIVENAAALAEQSLQDRPTVSAYTASTAAEATVHAPSASSSTAGLHRHTTPTVVETHPPNNVGIASVRPAVQSNIVNNNADAPVRIAPGMPWEHAGTVRPSLSNMPSVLSSTNLLSSDPSTGNAAVSSAPSSSDRRQRLRCDNYDTIHGRLPVESLASNLSSASWDPSAAAEAMMAMSAEGEDAYSSSNSAGHNGNSNSRKRRAEAASSEENSKLSAEDVSISVTTTATNTPSPTEEELAHQRAARVAETDARLRHLAQELCPLIDRFGRVLTDVAPHLWELGEMDTTPPAAAQNTTNNATTGRAAPENAHANAANAFEASLLALLRERPPSPPPRRSYRTPIALQTRIGGIGTDGSLGGAASFGLSGGMMTNNIMASLLGDLALLGQGAPGTGTGPGSTTSRTVMLPGSGLNGGGTNGTRVDVHIAYLPQSQVPSRATTVSTQAQQRASTLANSVLQAQLAQNVAARAQLLSNRTQELNNYSIAIDEMLRSLNALPSEAGAGSSGATATTPSSGPGSSEGPSQSRPSRTTSEDGIMRGPMPTSSGIRSRTASAGNSAGVNTSIAMSTASTAPASAATSAPTSATTTSAPGAGTLESMRYGRVFASSILPGSLRSNVGRPSAFLVTPAGLQTAVRIDSGSPRRADTTGSSATAATSPPASTSSRANWMPPGASPVAPPAAVTATRAALGAAENGDEDPDAEAYADSFEVEGDEEEEDYSVSMESAEQREGRQEGALSVHSFFSMDASSEGHDRDRDGGEEEEEEEAAPLDDLLPTLSFNELGQSLMDVRAARVQLNRETALQDGADTDSNGNVSTSPLVVNHAATAVTNDAETTSAEVTTDSSAGSVPSPSQQQQQQQQQSGSVLDRIRRSFAF